MKVLIACEYSGRVRRAFDALGHDVLSADFEPAEDGSQFHYQGDCFDLINDQHFDLMIAHPPCTYLTCSTEWAYGDGPYHQKLKPETLAGAARRAAREDAIDFVMRLANAPIDRIAIENPVGVLSKRWMPASQYINPHQFGDDASKKTGLWLKGLPLLTPTEQVEGRLICCGHEIHNDDKYGCPDCEGANRAARRWANQTDSGQNRLAPGAGRWKERSRTYQGIAEAMAEQWGNAARSAA